MFIKSEVSGKAHCSECGEELEAHAVTTCPRDARDLLALREEVRALREALEEITHTRDPHGEYENDGTIARRIARLALHATRTPSPDAGRAEPKTCACGHLPHEGRMCGVPITSSSGKGKFGTSIAMCGCKWPGTSPPTAADAGQTALDAKYPIPSWDEIRSDMQDGPNEPCASSPATADEAERAAREWLDRYWAGTGEGFDTLAALLRARDRAAREAALEEAVHELRFMSCVCAKRIEALAARRPGGGGK